ncbi:MAG TPA: hypothetical protein VNF74_06490, partial [Terriglobales bacterium]|nr:hypothetical protein [Terriglobales bacterium]
MKRIIPILIGLTLWAPAQMGNFLMARIGDRRYAAAFANWTARTATPVLTPGVATVEVTPAQVTLVANKTMAPVAAGTPVKVIDGTTSEVVTPTSVNCDARGCTMTAIFAAPHPGGFRLGSADFGLEEAIRDAAATGGIVVVGPEWSGSTAQIVHASGQAGVAVLDERGGGEVAYRWNGTTYNPELSINAGGGVNIASPAVTPTSIEGVVLADQFCAVPGTLDQTCIAGALASIGSSAATLFVPTGTYAIGANLTIPANVHLHFAQGAVWDVLVPHIVTIEGTITAGSYQIFSTTLPATAQGAMTSGSSTLAISSGTFTGADVGSPVYVTGTGTSTAMVSDINRVIGIGDGTTTTFTAAAAMLPVNASSLLVWAGTCAGIDNGSGAFENFFGSSCNVTG